MRKPVRSQEDQLPVELLSLYQRIDCNAKLFGMSPSEVVTIKKECKIAYQHKLVLEKVKQKKQR